MPETFKALDRKIIDQVRARIKNTRPLLNKIGIQISSVSQDSFKKQSLGEIKWHQRYPNQSEPFINIAGALSDLNKGSNIKARRFERRPAVMDTGTLQKSIKHRIVSGDTVAIGTVLPYAKFHQHGLTSVMPVTQTAREKLAKLMKTSRTGKKKNKDALSKLGFLFQTDQLKTKIVKRPFIGLTDELQKDIPRTVKRYIETGETQ